MPPKMKPQIGEGSSSKRKKKNKQPTQRPPMQRVLLIGADGKRRFIWRPW